MPPPKMPWAVAGSWFTLKLRPVASKLTGIVFIDVGWINRVNERRGYPLEAEVKACWNVEDESNPLDPGVGFVDADFESVDAAIAWARERAPVVLVRLEPTEDDMYSAGEERAMNDLSDQDDPDADPELVPLPEWPPDGWNRG
jgi:hypothetical protein